MPEETFSGESQETPWTPPFDPEMDAPRAAPPELVVDTAPLSQLALAAAGVGALNVLFTFAATVSWLIDEELGSSIIWASNGLWLLLGIAGIGLGAYVQRQQKRAGVQGGTAGMICTAAILSGGLIMSCAVLLPMISAIGSILGSGS